MVGAGVVMLAGCLWKGGHWIKNYKVIGGSMNPVAMTESGQPMPSLSSANWVDKADIWGDGAIKVGVSFIAAIVAGCLLRSFFKGMLSLIVIIGATLFFLHYRGSIDPFWSDYLSQGSEVKGWFAVEGMSVWTFVRDVVPSTGAALIGFGFGIKR